MGQSHSTPFGKGHLRIPTVPAELRTFTLLTRVKNIINHGPWKIKNEDEEGQRAVESDIPIPATKEGMLQPLSKLDWVKDKFHAIQAHPCFHPNSTKLKDSQADEEADDDHHNKVHKQNWNRKIHLAIYALAINESTILSVSSDCFKHGGAIFFIAYALVLLLIIQPLVYMELLVGQLFEKCISTFGSVHMCMRALPLAILFTALLFSSPSLTLGLSGNYILGAVSADPANCSDSWNSVNDCLSYAHLHRFKASPRLKGKALWRNTTNLLSTELYFREFILGESVEDDTRPSWNPSFFVGMGLAYLITFLSLRQLSSCISKVLVRLSLLVPILLFLLLVSQFARAGALDGFLYFFDNGHWTNILSPQFWVAVFRSALVSSGVGRGLYCTLASKNPFTKSSLYRTSFLLIILMLAVVLLSTFVIATEMGSLRHTFNTSYSHTLSQGTSSSFVGICGALLMLDSHYFVLTFFTLFYVGTIWTAVVATEVVTTHFVDSFSFAERRPKMARQGTLIFIILIQTALLILLAKVGRVLVVVESALFSGGWAITFVSLMQVISILYFYDFQHFLIDMELMLHHSASKLFQLEFKYVLPPALLGVLITLSYGFFQVEEASLQGNPLQTFMLWIGYTFNAIPPALFILGVVGGISHQEWINLFFCVTVKRQIQNIFRRRNALVALSEENLQEPESPSARERRKRNLQTLGSLRQLRLQLTQIKNFRNARAHWLRLFNIIRTLWTFRTLHQLSLWFLRDIELKNDIKEVKFLRKVLSTYSLESIFAAASLQVDFGNEAKERRHLANVLLNNLPANELDFQYPELTITEKLFGKGNPTPAQDKKSTIIRIKRHLHVSSNFDETLYFRSLAALEEKRRQNSVYYEDTPKEFHFQYAESDIRVILFRGLDHSLLTGTPRLGRRVLSIKARDIRWKTDLRLRNYVRELVTSQMEGNWESEKVKLIARERLRKLDLDSEDDDDNFHSMQGEWRTSKVFTPLRKWFHSCDTRRFAIDLKNTVFVAIVMDEEKLRGRGFFLTPNLEGPKYKGFVKAKTRKNNELEESSSSSEDAHPSILSPNLSPIQAKGKKEATSRSDFRLRPESKFSAIDTHFRRQLKQKSSIYPLEKSFSESLLMSTRRRVFEAQDSSNKFPLSTRHALPADGVTGLRKGRRELEEFNSENERQGSHSIGATSQMDVRSSANVHLEKSMTDWISDLKRKTRSLNEEDTFLYRDDGKRLTVELREGSQKPSKSNIASPATRRLNIPPTRTHFSKKSKRHLHKRL